MDKPRNPSTAAYPRPKLPTCPQCHGPTTYQGGAVSFLDGQVRVVRTYECMDKACCAPVEITQYFEDGQPT